MSIDEIKFSIVEQIRQGNREVSIPAGAASRLIEFVDQASAAVTQIREYLAHVDIPPAAVPTKGFVTPDTWEEWILVLDQRRATPLFMDKQFVRVYHAIKRDKRITTEQIRFLHEKLL